MLFNLSVLGYEIMFLQIHNSIISYNFKFTFTDANIIWKVKYRIFWLNTAFIHFSAPFHIFRNHLVTQTVTSHWKVSCYFWTCSLLFSEFDTYIYQIRYKHYERLISITEFVCLHTLISFIMLLQNVRSFEKPIYQIHITRK